MIKTCLHLSFKLKPYNFSHLQGTNLVPCSQFPKSPEERPFAQLRLGICPWSSQLQSGRQGSFVQYSCLYANPMGGEYSSLKSRSWRLKVGKYKRNRQVWSPHLIRALSSHLHNEILSFNILKISPSNPRGKIVPLYQNCLSPETSVKKQNGLCCFSDFTLSLTPLFIALQSVFLSVLQIYPNNYPFRTLIITVCSKVPCHSELSIADSTRFISFDRSFYNYTIWSNSLIYLLSQQHLSISEHFW